MTMKHPNNETDTLLIKSGEGRTYNCGTMTAIFKADENETDSKYSISEWWLDPNSKGVGAHQHENNDEIFYGIKGTTSILVADKWIDLKKGDFLRIPAKTFHDFENRTNKKAAVLNVYIPGGFENNMPEIVKWFKEKI